MQDLIKEDMLTWRGRQRIRRLCIIPVCRVAPRPVGALADLRVGATLELGRYLRATG